MTKAQAIAADRESAIASLRTDYHLSAGSILYVVQRHRSASGMSRWLDVFAIIGGEPYRLTHTVSEAAGLTYDRRREAIRVDACGLSIPRYIADALGRAMGVKLQTREI